MKKFKKAVVLMLSILVILAFANYSFARTISGSNSTNSSNVTNTEDDDTDTSNDVDNTTENNTSNQAGLITTNNTPKTINSSNVSESLPNTGLSSAELNLALILLLALVFGMFSLVQYNKIVKKDNE